MEGTPRGTDLPPVPNPVTLPRCVCGGVAEWHYTLARKDGDLSGTIPRYRLAEGTRCWAPGQGTIGIAPHVLTVAS